MSAVTRPERLLDPGLCLTLRPMTYPSFFERYRSAIKNTWTVEEVDFATDIADLAKMSPAERHMIERLIAFFATGDSIVSNNLVLTLYRHLNAPEARMYLRANFTKRHSTSVSSDAARTYVPIPKPLSRVRRVEKILHPQKGRLLPALASSTEGMQRLESRETARVPAESDLLAACIEGLFFFGAFAYCTSCVRAGSCTGSPQAHLVFRDESAHMAFAFEVVRTVREEEPELFDAGMEREVYAMLDEAIAAETLFAEDLLQGGVAGMSAADVRKYLEFCADQRLATLGLARRYGAKNPFSFLDLQDVQEVTNFFERRVSASVRHGRRHGEVVLDASF